MPLIMQLERHLTNQGIIFISTPLIMLFFGQSPEQSHSAFLGHPFVLSSGYSSFWVHQGMVAQKERDSSACTSKVRAFCLLQNPTYRCQDAGRYVGRSLGFSFHMVGGRHWKSILDEHLFSGHLFIW